MYGLCGKCWKTRLATLNGTPPNKERLDEELPYTVGEAVWAVRHEMARNVEDVLARRLRALVLNSRAALRSAPQVARLAATELGRDQAWARQEIDRFQTAAQGILGF